MSNINNNFNYSGPIGSSGSSGSSGPTGDPTKHGVYASFMRGSMSSSTGPFDLFSTIPFSIVDNTSGPDISLLTNGSISLAAGKIYKLRASVPTWIDSSTNTIPAFSWYNVTSSNQIGSAQCQYSPNSTSTFGGFGDGTADAIITATQQTNVDFRIISLQNGPILAMGAGSNIQFGIAGTAPWFDIQVISVMAPIQSSINYWYGIANNRIANPFQFSVSSSVGNNIVQKTPSTFTLVANGTYKCVCSIGTQKITSSNVTYQWMTDTGGVFGNQAQSVAGYSNNILAVGYISVTTTPINVYVNANYFNNTNISLQSWLSIEQVYDNTSITAYKGATDTMDGNIGYVPAPAAGQQNYVLSGNGTWVSNNTTVQTYQGATSDADGTMGLVPAPRIGQQNFILSGNGTWIVNNAAVPYKGATDITDGNAGYVPALGSGQQNFVLSGKGLWVPGISSGMIMAWSPPKTEAVTLSGIAPFIPSGWVICDGTKETPDLRGRFVLMAQDSIPLYNAPFGSTARFIGSTGGGENHVLTINEIPTHSHSGGSVHPGGGPEQTQSNGVEDRTNFNIQTGNTGGSQPHNNMPPYYTLVYIMYL